MIRYWTRCCLLLVMLVITFAKVTAFLTEEAFEKTRESNVGARSTSFNREVTIVSECIRRKDKVNCKTKSGNKCISINHNTYECICSEPTFIRIAAQGFHAEICQKCNETIGYQVEDGKCIKKYCDRKQERRCRTNIPGNTCTLMNEGHYECECNATGYQIKRTPFETCESTNCTFFGNYVCKTYKGNKCTRLVDQNSQICTCSEPDFINFRRRGFDSCKSCNKDIGFGAKNGTCVRKYCNIEQRQNCKKHVKGNTCTLENKDEYHCKCNATGYEMNKCESTASVCSDRCICSEPDFVLVLVGLHLSCKACNEANGFRIEDGKCVRTFCDREHMQNCRVNIPGNTCKDGFRCECNATGYERRREKLELSKCGRSNNYNCNMIKLNVCSTISKPPWFECILETCQERNENNGFESEDGKLKMGIVKRVKVKTAKGKMAKLTMANESSCNETQKKYCSTKVLGNDCRLVNDTDHKCECNAAGYEERNGKCMCA